jgi:hypothetical protein
MDAILTVGCSARSRTDQTIHHEGTKNTKKGNETSVLLSLECLTYRADPPSSSADDTSEVSAGQDLGRFFSSNQAQNSCSPALLRVLRVFVVNLVS